MTLRVWRLNARRKRRWNCNNLLDHWGQSQISPIVPIQFKPVHITWDRASVLRQCVSQGGDRGSVHTGRSVLSSMFWLEESPSSVSSSWDLKILSLHLHAADQTAVVAPTERMAVSRTKKKTGVFLLLSFTMSDLGGDLHLFFHPKPLCSGDANLAVYWSLESFGNLHGQNCIFSV